MASDIMLTTPYYLSRFRRKEGSERRFDRSDLSLENEPMSYDHLISSEVVRVLIR